MKDYLKTSWWVNRFPHNPTQTHYNRFLKKAGSKMRSKFTESQEGFDRQVSSGLQTIYSDFFKDANNAS